MALVQLPLPKHIDEGGLSGHAEDVDLFAGQCGPWCGDYILPPAPCRRGGAYRPQRYGHTAGPRYIGSNGCGRSGAAMLHRHATVTICHMHQNLADITRQPIFCGSGGQVPLCNRQIANPGHRTRCGVNRLPDGTLRRCGLDAAERWLSDYPGARGVGPMTIAMLMKNTCGSSLSPAPAVTW